MGQSSFCFHEIDKGSVSPLATGLCGAHYIKVLFLTTFLRDIAGRLNTSQSTVCRHVEKLGKVGKLGVRGAAHNLSERTKEDHVSIAKRLLSRVKIQPFLDRIITGDEI